MKKIIHAFFCIMFLFPAQASAQTFVARSSASLTAATITPLDNRAKILNKFLNKHSSPLAPYSKVFVEEADRNNIDWRLVAAISGNESQFGELIPPYSNNGWGFGVYGNNVRHFSSWEEGIITVSKAIREDYIDKWGAKNIYEIGSIYAEDPMWANKVSYYISEIDNFEAELTNTSISISL